MFGSFNATHEFDGVTFRYSDGSVVSYKVHSKGNYHMHKTIDSRIDGFSKGFAELNSDTVDITISNNIVIIKEV